MGPEDAFERLLRGETPKTPEEQALGLFLQDVDGAFPAEPLLADEAHLAAIVQAAQLLADKGEPAVRSASKADGRAPHASGLPKRRRVIMKAPLMRSLAAKVVAGLVVLMSMFGGLALAGALPGQGSADDATDVVEIQNVSDEAPETEAPETEDADDQGENEDADDQGENEDADDQGEDVNDDQDADDQGENEDADDQGDDDQGENEGADDQGEDVNDDQGDDDQGENEDADDQGDNDQGEQD
jgi:cobalamin biosynthesis protein CobT